MSLNLWKLAGMPTNYSPLPSGYHGNIKTHSANFIFSFKAYSNSGDTSFRISNGISTRFLNISDKLERYELTFKEEGSTNFWINDRYATGEIFISDIELIEKPLGKATINGVDGFLSGKWNIHPNARVIDDETLELNATANSQSSYIYIDTIIGEKYSVSFEGDGYIYVNGNSLHLVDKPSGSYNFTADSKSTRVIMYNWTKTGKIKLRKPILNLGSTPAPYSKKTGERMVVPNVKKSNLFNPHLLKSTVSNGTFKEINLKLKPKTYYVLSSDVPGSSSGVASESRHIYFNSTGADMAVYEGYDVYRMSDDEGNLTVYFYDNRLFSQDIIDEKYYVQLEEGMLSSIHSKYEVSVNREIDSNKIAKSGVLLNGGQYLHFDDTSDYKSQSIKFEIECKLSTIENYVTFIANRATSHYGLMIFANRSNIYVQHDTSTNRVMANHAISLNETFKLRVEIKNNLCEIYFNEILLKSELLVNPIGFTETGLYIGRDSSQNQYHLIGEIYGCSYSTEGKVFFDYDLTTHDDIIGGMIISKSENLIPSFIDKKWSLHRDFKILGKDVGELQATSFSTNEIFFDCEPNQKYLLHCRGNGRLQLASFNQGIEISNTYTSESKNIHITHSNATKLRVRLVADKAGNFNFEKPQLFKIMPNIGTIHGNIVQNSKSAKRTFYAKR